MRSRKHHVIYFSQVEIRPNIPELYSFTLFFSSWISCISIIFPLFTIHSVYRMESLRPILTPRTKTFLLLVLGSQQEGMC